MALLKQFYALLALLFTTSTLATVCVASAGGDLYSNSAWAAVNFFAIASAGAGSWLSQRCTLQIVTFLLIFFHSATTLIVDFFQPDLSLMATVYISIAFYAFVHKEKAIGWFLSIMAFTTVLPILIGTEYTYWETLNNVLVVALFVFVATISLKIVLHRINKERVPTNNKSIYRVSDEYTRRRGIHRVN